MIFSSIRSRMLLVTLVPVTLVVIAVVLVFWSGRIDDLDDAHVQRSRLIARQVAVSSEFGLFTGNASGLQGMLAGVAKEPEIAGVAVFDSRGAQVAAAGRSMPGNLESASNVPIGDPLAGRRFDIVVEPVMSTQVALDDLFTQSQQKVGSEPAPLGYVVLQVSRSDLEAKRQRSIELAVILGAIALILGGFLAVRLGRMVVGPIMRVSRMIQRIGRGDFSPQTNVSPSDPLFDLQLALNHMAQRLGWGREEFERQIQQATEELREKKEEAEQATQAKSRFLAAASHDLRQPTHALGMFIARMGQLPMDAQMSNLVRNLEASVQSMQDLLDSLLDLSRLESGAMPVVPGPVSVMDVLDGIFPSLRQTAAAKGLELRIRRADLWVQSDVALLQRIVLNLVHNALRYTESGGILVACRQESQGRRVRLEVWDTGIGISTTDQVEIFKEFYQVSNPGRARHQGLGLGLNIVKRSADLLGHTISVSSRPGVGTRFVLSMQRAQSIPRAQRSLNVRADEPVGELAGHTILMVDDDAFIVASMESLMESWGCKVWVANSAMEAVSLVQRAGFPDAIISDVELGPGANGLELVADIRRLAGRTIPACLISGNTGAELQMACRAVGLTLLHKPVRPAKLRNMLRRMVVLENQGLVGL